MLPVTMMLGLAMIAAMANGAPTASPEPRKCCFDKQFSAVLADVGAVGSQSNSLFYLDGTTSLAYDFYQQRSKTFTRLENPDGSHIVTEELHDYTHGITYTTDGSGNCTAGPLKPYEYMFDGCIPAHAEYLGPSVFGQGVFTLNVHTWSFLIPGNHSDPWQILMSVTQQNCVPVLQTLMGSLNGALFEESLLFTDYQPGLDSSVSFVPPPHCRSHAPLAPAVGR